MTALKSVLAIVCALACCHLAISVDYCDKSLCEEDEHHIACNNNGKPSSKCSKKFKIVETKKPLSDYIVKAHNELRNKVAQGFDKFPPAARMGTVQWDNELAKLAELNVKRCDFEHDECNNSPRFLLTGQNLASRSVSGKSNEQLIDEHVSYWFSEFKDATVGHIKSYPDDEESSNDIGHFMQVILENAVYVGCAIGRDIKSKGESETLSCNYSYANIPGEPTYTQGKPGSMCKTGTNPNYKFLCSTKEKYEF